MRVVVLLIYPLTLFRVMYGNKASELPERTNEVTGLYAEACQAVAKENDLPVIDLWSSMQRRADWAELYLR